MNDVLNRDDWHAIMTTPAEYPDVPDDIRRTIADLAISVRRAGEQLEEGLFSGNNLVTYMPLALISSGLRRLNALVDRELSSS
jgi:hypothetical protein